jgi:hypothetical protein
LSLLAGAELNVIVTLVVVLALCRAVMLVEVSSTAKQFHPSFAPGMVMAKVTDGVPVEPSTTEKAPVLVPMTLDPVPAPLLTVGVV